MSDGLSDLMGTIVGAGIGILAVAALTLNNTAEPPVDLDDFIKKDGITACQMYQEFAKKADPYITKDGQSATVQVKLGDGTTCDFQHVPKAPVIVVPLPVANIS